MQKPSDIREGIRKGLPLVLPTLAGGITFGVLAQPVMGSVAPVVMSIVVFSGAAQFAALTVLTAGGGALAAIAAGMLMNGRWLPMGLAIGPFLSGGRRRRAAQSLALVDASFALASRGDGTYDRGILIGATLPQAAAWTGGTLIGVLSGSVLTDPSAFGLDAIFPAFFAVLLWGEARGRMPMTAALIGAAIALALMPFAPPGVPVLAASAAALLGLRARAGKAGENARAGKTGENARDSEPAPRPGTTRTDLATGEAS
jgi:4-azaleucine resistance transporter AzlC